MDFRSMHCGLVQFVTKFYAENYEQKVLENVGIWPGSGGAQL